MTELTDNNTTQEQPTTAQQLYATAAQVVTAVVQPVQQIADNVRGTGILAPGSLDDGTSAEPPMPRQADRDNPERYLSSVIRI